MRWIGTDGGFEIVEVNGETKAVTKAEFFELFPEHAPQVEVPEEPAEETKEEPAKPAKGK